MIKIVYCLRRKPEMSLEEFQKYWLETHAEFGANIPGVKRYVQAHALGGELAEMMAEGHPAGKNEPFDGVAELWWDSLEDVAAALATPEGAAAGAALLEDERRFIDLERSPLGLGREHVIVED